MFLSDKFRKDKDTDVIGRMTLENLRVYTKKAKVERIDHSVHWMEIGEYVPTLGRKDPDSLYDMENKL